MSDDHEVDEMREYTNYIHWPLEKILEDNNY